MITWRQFVDSFKTTKIKLTKFSDKCSCGCDDTPDEFAQRTIMEQRQRIHSQGLKIEDQKDELLILRKQIRFEELMRDSYPDLQDAWEQYQILLTLRKSE